LRRFKVIVVDIDEGESKKEGKEKENIEKKGKKENLQK